MLERLREQIRCIEGRVSTLEPVDRNAEPSRRDELRSAGFEGDLGDGVPGHRHASAPGASSGAPKQAGLPADRFADEDGCVAFPTHTPAMQPSSSLSSPSFPAAPCSPLGLAAPACHPEATGGASRCTGKPSASSWTLGPDFAMSRGGGLEMQSALADLALDEGGVHEIKPAFGLDGAPRSAWESEVDQSDGFTGDWAAGWAAALAFATALMARRVEGLRLAAHGERGSGEPGSAGLLWCFSRSRCAEHGLPYVHGLEAFGLSPGQVMIAEAGNEAEVLWALEEGLRSGAPTLVAGFVDDLALTPARRLALAAQKHGVPCLILTDPRAPPAAATASRWRVGPAPSGPHPLAAGQQGEGRKRGRVPSLPGPRRFALTLERYRQAPIRAGSRIHFVEWRHEAVCFDLVAAVSDRPAAARQAGTGAVG
jgi:hypothetical protein